MPPVIQTPLISLPSASGFDESDMASSWVAQLTTGQEAEVLRFLQRRPIHTIIMSGLIRDNGLHSTFNRGTFYGCRNKRGELEGVALIGHLTMVETDSEIALAGFAQQAGTEPRLHTIIGERDTLRHFWSCFPDNHRMLRLHCQELLFVQRHPPAVRAPVKELRLAGQDDLELVAVTNAAIAESESGVNPLHTDREGFYQRCARRIEQGRVWIWRDGGRLIFKADVFAETPQVNYLEGIFVHPQERGKGYGLRCLAQLSRDLLLRTRAVSLLVNEQNLAAQSLYRRAGYKLRGAYSAIFVNR